MNVQNVDVVTIEDMQISESFLEDMKRVVKSNINLNVLEVMNYINETVTFTIIGADRLEATLICLLKASYVIQSQRYVKNNLSSFRSLNSSSEELNRKYDILLKDTMDLYNRMTEIKEESKNKKRTTVSDYKHGIPIEDARYLFPLSAKTNISITMSGDKFLAFLTLLNRHKSYVMRRLYDAIENTLESKGVSRFVSYATYDYLVFNIFATNREELFSLKDNVAVNVNDKGVDNIVRGILTSTTDNPIESALTYDTEAKKNGIINRVTGYNHTSVLEQYRFKSLMKCSLVTFQQLSRHRIAITQPVPPQLLTQLYNTKEHVIPHSIEKSQFLEEYKDICDRYNQLIKECIETDNVFTASCLLQNGDVVPFNYTVNVRTDIEVMNKRLCANAQWEIRELMRERKKLMERTNLAEIYKTHARPDCLLKRGCQEGAYSCDPKVREQAKNK